MTKYQIIETIENSNHAGSKAVKDVKEIAEELGFKPVNIKNRSFGKQSFITRILNQLSCFFYWITVYVRIEKKSVVLMQWPYRRRQIGYRFIMKNLKRIKKCKIVSIVHDVEELRTIYFSKHIKNDFDLMSSISDVLIVHNERMKEFFISKGICEDKLIVLEIFDYLTNAKENFIPEFSKSIVIAGNLDKTKSPYLSKLSLVKDVSFQLYGPNVDQNLLKSKNIEYMGSVAPDELPQHLNSGFGLVWDGDSIDTCSGNTGNYLRYNNPHKLSLYIASGLPVVIWSEAAEASFVKKYDVGLTVASLEELSRKLQLLTESEYNRYARNVSVLAKKLVNGEFTQKAVNDAVLKVSN